jgi:peroxiredoxin
MKRRLLLSALIALTAAIAANLPRQAAELTYTTPDGKTISLSQYKGKVVAVCFILTGCSHCQKTTGFLVKAQKDLGPRGFQVLSAAINQDAATQIPTFIKNFNTNYPIGAYDGMKAIEWMQHPAMLIPHMPLLAFVDKQGKVRAQYEGDNEQFFGDTQEQNIRTQIETLLKEGSAAPAKKAPATASSASKKGTSN